ncbi:MAG: SDR family NAD(P)-dependent oxidoreductase, partial [Candidatus Lokiarchaeota archaeon]
MKKWFKAEFHNYEDNENQFKQFSRKFLFKVLAMGHSQFAQLIKAKGPNTHINVACASGSQAIGIAENWIRIGRCNRVIIISADNSTSKNLFPWIGSGFLASGAATTQESFENAVLPFGKGRNGLILGAGASALVIEDFPSSIKRGINPIVEILGTYYSNSAFHGSRLDKSHIIGEFEKFISQMVQRYDLSKQELAEQGFFMSHETYTPARGGSAETELEVLSSSFGKDVRKMIITNTKGFTGHPLGVGIEEAVAIKALEFEKIPPIANYSNIDPIFKAKYTFSNGLQTSKKYAIRFAAGFGSQLSINLFKFYARGERRLEPEYSKWLEKISGTNELFYDGKVLKVKTIKPEESVQISQSQKDFTHKNEIVSPTITKINQRNLLNTIKQIIAEITGYEPEDIESDYDLEEDLGIDTIKQAEIFGEIRAKWQIPEDIEVNLADFRTIKDILEFLTRNISQSKENDNVLAAFQSDFGSNIEDIEQKIKQIIADITGYEPEDIESDYDLEEDLGIDTIKQAEIFGEIRAKWQIPEDIEVNLADFRTIKDILEFLTKTITPSEEISNISATVQSELTSNIEDTEQKIKQIIAKITGYEPEDIETDYDLEEDLGIDTIKQAEIFGEIRSKWQIPEDIEVNLADFRTIKDIQEFLYQKSAQKSLISSKTSKTDKSEEIDGELEDQNQIQIYDFKPFQIDYPNENKSAIKLNSQTTLWLSILEEETQNSELAHLFKDNFDSYTKVNIDLSTDLTSKKVLDKEYSQIIITHPYNSSIDYSKALILFSKLFEYFHNNYIQSIQKLILYSFEDLIDEYYKSNSNSSYVVNPLVGALNVFCRSLSKEFNFEFKHISASTSSYLITEMKYWDNLKEIFYDKTGNRYTLIKIPINTKQNNKEIEIDSNDIMIVTGGAHGIAFDCIDSLTMNYQPKIALIGRTSLDDSIKQYLDYSKDQLNEYEKEFKKLQKERYPEATPLFIRKNWQRFIYKIKIHRNIKKLKEKGLNVEYYSADVLDLKQVKDAITKIKSSFKGDIKILIHAAGIEESKSFLKKQLDMAQKIVKVKVVGLANLFECIDEKDLKLCMMFSSIAGRYGNIAQIDYAFANGFLSRLAWNKQKCPYLAIDWSAWAGKGMATRGSTKKVLTMAGVVPIPLEKGAKIFTELIKNRFLGEYLVCGDLGQFELTQSNKFTVSDPTFPCLNQILYKDNKIHAEKILNLQDDIYLLDHQIEQQPIFPGVMGLEMFIEFNNFMNHNDVKQIKNVEFNKPIKLL